MTHRMVEQSGHDVPNLRAGSRRIFQRVQPLLNLHRANFREPLRTPSGIDMTLQIDFCRFDGSERLPIGNEFLLSIEGYELSHCFRWPVLGVDIAPKR